MKAAKLLSDPESTDQQRLSVKQRAGDAANRWLARNRSLVLRQTPVWAQSLALILIGVGSIGVIGGIFFRIDEVVSVRGQLKSIGGTIEVETPVGGRVAEVLFKDGEKIQKGQLLVRFDTTEAQNQRETLVKLIANEKNDLQIQLKTFDSQMNTLSRRKDVLSRRLSTKNAITNEMKNLVAQGGFQRIQYLEQLDQLYGIQQQISEIDEERSRLLLQKSRLNLNSEKSIEQMQNSLKNAELKLRYQTVKAPVSGIIFDPKARKEGVLQAGERIVSIVPQEGLFAEVFVPNGDIGFVKVGQKAKVRVDAFPFSRYGELNGKVSYISADALSPTPENNFYRFPVKLSIENSFLESQGTKIPLQSGMSITSNLKLRDKRVISLVSDLLVDQTDSIRSIRQQ